MAAIGLLEEGVEERVKGRGKQVEGVQAEVSIGKGEAAGGVELVMWLWHQQQHP